MRSQDHLNVMELLFLLVSLDDDNTATDSVSPEPHHGIIGNVQLLQLYLLLLRDIAHKALYELVYFLRDIAHLARNRLILDSLASPVEYSTIPIL